MNSKVLERTTAPSESVREAIPKLEVTDREQNLSELEEAESREKGRPNLPPPTQPFADSAEDELLLISKKEPSVLLTALRINPWECQHRPISQSTETPEAPATARLAGTAIETASDLPVDAAATACAETGNEVAEREASAWRHDRASVEKEASLSALIQ